MSVVEFTRRPGAVFSAAALASAGVAAVLSGLGSLPALGLGAVGLLALIVGLTRGGRRIAAIGSFVLVAAVLAAGVAGAGPERLLPALVAALLSREFGLESFAAGEELRGGTVERAELLHVGVAAGVGALAAGVVYGIYRTVAVGSSVAGVALLLIAVVALGLALRE